MNKIELTGDPGPEPVIPCSKENMHVSRVFNVDDSADTQEAIDEFLKEISKSEVGIMKEKTSVVRHILTPDEFRILLKYWIVVMSAVLTYLLLFGISRL